MCWWCMLISCEGCSVNFLIYRDFNESFSCWIFSDFIMEHFHSKRFISIGNVGFGMILFSLFKIYIWYVWLVPSPDTFQSNTQFKATLRWNPIYNPGKKIWCCTESILFYQRSRNDFNYFLWLNIPFFTIIILEFGIENLNSSINISIHCFIFSLHRQKNRNQKNYLNRDFGIKESNSKKDFEDMISWYFIDLFSRSDKMGCPVEIGFMVVRTPE